MVTVAAYVLTYLAVSFGVTSALPSLFGAYSFRFLGTFAWQIGAFSGGLMSWLAVNWLWSGLVEGYPTMPVAAAGAVFFSYLGQAAQWDYMNKTAQVAMGGEVWSLVLFTVFLLMEPSAPWY